MTPGSLQPLEIATKDGSWCIFTSTRNPFARWCAQYVDGMWMDIGGDRVERNPQLIFTHWMAFPERPAHASDRPSSRALAASIRSEAERRNVIR